MESSISGCFRTLADSIKNWVEQRKWKDIYTRSWKPFSQRFEKAQQAVRFENALQHLIGEQPQFCEMLCENLLKSESISLIKFMEKHCDFTSYSKNHLISCKKALQRLDRKGKIQLPKTGQRRKGQSQLYDAQKLAQNRPQYIEMLKGKLPTLKLS